MFQKRHRIFIAINLPGDVKKELAKFQERFTVSQGEGLGEWAKWTAKDNLHITLIFLGHLTDQELVDVCEICNNIAKNHAPFSIELNKILQVPKFIWAEGEKSEGLSELKNDLEKELLEKISFKPEGRRFSPHVTLARIREWQFRQIEPEERPEIEKDINLIFTVESIEVMESELKRGGPQYTVLESCPLKD